MEKVKSWPTYEFGCPLCNMPSAISADAFSIIEPANEAVYHCDNCGQKFIVVKPD